MTSSRREFWSLENPVVFILLVLLFSFAIAAVLTILAMPVFVDAGWVKP